MFCKILIEDDEKRYKKNQIFALFLNDGLHKNDGLAP